MALLACKDCGKEVSSNADSCPHCGARVPKTKWWLWMPLAVGAAVLIIGASIPKNQADANAFARACREMFANGQVASMYDCNKIEREIRNRPASPPAPIGRWEMEKFEAEQTAKRNADPVYQKDQAERKAQAVKECEPILASQKQKYKFLFAAKKYSDAADAIRPCASALEDQTLKQLAADAEIKAYVQDIKSSKTTKEQKLKSYELLQKEYPEHARQFEQLMKRLHG